MKGTLPGSALPNHVSLDAAGNSGWHVLLAAQAYARAGGETFYNDQLLLGFLIKDLWDHRSTSTIAPVAYAHLLRKLFACNDTSGSGLVVGSSDELKLISERVCTIGIQARNCLMSAFEDTWRYTLDPYDDPRPRPSVPETIDRMLEGLKEPNHRQKKMEELKLQALVRDGLKCIVNNWPDGECSGLFRGQETPRGPDGVNDTQCLVLVPINIAEEGGHDKPKWSPIPLLHFLGLWDRVSGLAAKCGGIGNIMSVDSALRFGFDTFYWWLEEVPGKRNTYRIQMPEGADWRRCHGLDNTSGDGTVTFSLNPLVEAKCSELGVDVSATSLLPNRELIAFRAMCARVANTSGAGLHKLKLERERESHQEAKQDGSSGHLLISLIYSRVPLETLNI